MEFETEPDVVDSTALESPAKTPEITNAKMAYARCKELIDLGENNGSVTDENSNESRASLSFDGKYGAYRLKLTDVVAPGAGSSYGFTYYYFYPNEVKFTSSFLMVTGYGAPEKLTEKRLLRTAFAYLQSFKHDPVNAERRLRQNLTDASLLCDRSF